MTSIRRHILLWLLPGFVVLWAATGTVLYWAVKERFEVQLDAELRELWAAIPFGSHSNRPTLLTIEDFARDDFGIYFQVRTSDGLRILKSENLGRFSLPFTSSIASEPHISNATLDNGDPVRLLSVEVEAGGELGQLHVVVAKSRERAIAALRKMLFAIVSAGLGAGVVFALLLSQAIRSGLRPLHEVAERASKIGAATLTERFPQKEMPSELLPIVSKLNDLLDRLRASFRRERRFSADLAHELRTPVAAMRTTAEVALRFPDQADSGDYRDILQISGELQDTIENLLVLGRLENADKDELALETVSLSEQVQRSWQRFEDLADEREISLKTFLSGSDSLSTDPKLLQLILSNLFSNAVDYSPEGSEIVVDSEGDAVLNIRNPAPHLTPKDLPRLFDRLWRHDEARTDTNHCGLGLSIAKSAAAALGLCLVASLRKNDLQFSLKKS